ncbi:DNA topoisomerase 3 [Megasphaera sueciensis]|uniref:DNA topoisomerase 3 n=1 Tax=Megasphaera sueciensis TaxID=349094 RepID=UPI003D05295F
MRIFIAEKPSMARELAKCLPPPQHKKKGFIETGDGIVTWAYGHVLQQAEPQDYDIKYKTWKAEDLPIVPEEWKLLVSPDSKEQFQTICNLITQADSIINAGDPDREGQLLIDEILDYVGNTKPVQRILLNALDEKSIKESLADLRNNSDFLHLKESALARSRADWLIGMNLSRAYTLAARRQGHRVVFPIGRVKTPTLALVVRRQRELDHFVPVEYFIVKAVFIHANGRITAQWQPKDTQTGMDSEGHVIEEKAAQALIDRLHNNPSGVIQERKKTKKKEAQRLPLSLSSLQVLAGKRYGYDPQQVLDAAQQLYERKLTTYPRSDCEYLPCNQWKDRSSIIRNLQSNHAGKLSEWAEKADLSIKSRAWNDSKITAHHAIIPTTVFCDFSKLTSLQQHIYYLIAQAYIAQFYPLYEYDQTRILVAAASETFVAHGKAITVSGWKELYTSDKNDAEEEESDDGLPVVKKGDVVDYKEGHVDKKTTKPPPRFTPSTLLAAMKEIYKYVKDDSLKKKLKEVQGIGTEATRATIIDELIKRKFLVEEGKKRYLKPTDNAYLLVDALPDEMVYPDETAVWEDRLYKMSEGKEQLASFLQDQITFLEKLVARARDVKIVSNDTNKDQKICPQCGAAMVLRHGKYGDFFGCTMYPQCRYTEQVTAPLQEAEKKYKCPRCHNGYFICRTSSYGRYWVCSEPDCNTTCSDVEGKPSIFAK